MAASWECPPLPMISFALKDSSKAYFSQLKPLISSHYDESPESFSNEIHQLEQLRESALKPTRDYTGCNILRRYYAQIHLLKSRFPVEAVGPLPIDFSWKDLYTNADYRQKGLQIELASILYNIGER
jgi:tyrosine-protein phosphatase non-receptor type 23